MPRHPQRASVLLIVLVTVLFASVALVTFVERADDDLLAPKRMIDAKRLRTEAYSALETTLAALVDFRAANGNVLHSPAEGWSAPLDFDWVQYTPANSNRKVTVTFDDESGKIPLPTITDQNLTNFFVYYGLDPDTAGLLKDSLFTWMKQNYSPTATNATTPAQYEQNDAIPFTPPGRSLRSWDELANIDGVKDQFYDKDGRLTPLGKRFTNSFSTYSFSTSNVNGGKPDTLALFAQMNESQQMAVLNYLGNPGNPEAATTTRAPGFFTKIGDLATVASLQSNATTTGLGVNISALRVNVTVKEGLAVFTVSALVTWPTGTTATATAAPKPPVQANATATTASTITSSVPQTIQFNYPYTILELTENDLDPAAPPAQGSASASPTIALFPPAI